MCSNAGVKISLSETSNDGGLSENRKAKRYKRSKDVLNTVLSKTAIFVVLVTGIYNIKYC